MASPLRPALGRLDLLQYDLDVRGLLVPRGAPALRPRHHGLLYPSPVPGSHFPPHVVRLEPLVLRVGLCALENAQYGQRGLLRVSSRADLRLRAEHHLVPRVRHGRFERRDALQIGLRVVDLLAHEHLADLSALLGRNAEFHADRARCRLRIRLKSVSHCFTSLERHELRGPGSADPQTRVPHRFPGERELPEVVSYHLCLYVHRRELVSIVDMHRLADELGQDGYLPSVRPHGLFRCPEPPYERLLLGVEATDVCSSGPRREQLYDLCERQLQDALHRVASVSELLLPARLDLALLLPHLPSRGLG